MTAAVSLAIPDNTAETALATLNRLGFGLGTLERADIWRFTLEGELAPTAFLERVGGIELIYNLNKHRLALVERAIPDAGELWVRDVDESVPADVGEILRQFGAGGKAVQHRTAWRLLYPAGGPVPDEIVRRAAMALLYNPAFQQAGIGAGANPLP